jgi:hypothetical protein
MQPMLNIAVRAARRAGDLIVRNVDRVPTLGVRSKSRNDFVTEVDQLAERDIIETIRRTHPDHGFLGEESGRSGGDEFVWIIDPLDGTTNFLPGSRCSRSRLRSSGAAGSSTASSTTRCARNCTRRREATALSSTASGSGSASR